MTSAAVPAPSLWLGPFVHEAVAAYRRAREAGLTATRALVLGNVASFRDGWAFKRTLARQAGCSIRTVGRSLRQGSDEGLVGVARAKPNERPVAADGKLLAPIPCGWSHRWTIGWGKAGAEVKEAVARAKAKRLARSLVKREVRRGPARSRRHWTPEQIDAELERRARERPPEPDPPPE